MLRETPWGKTHVRVCRTFPAPAGFLRHLSETREKIAREGHVREDGEYSIEFMECLADCGEGPVVTDEETYEHDEEKAEKLADLMLKGNLDNSNEFVSYEKDSLDSSEMPKSSSKAKNDEQEYAQGTPDHTQACG